MEDTREEDLSTTRVDETELETKDKGAPDQPDAGGEAAGEKGQPTSEETEWDRLKSEFPWAHETIIKQRTRVAESRQQLEDRGFVLDEHGQIVSEPERLERVEKPRTEQEITDEVEARYADDIAMAQLDPEPAKALAKVYVKIARETAAEARRDAVNEVTPTTNEFVIESFKRSARDPKSPFKAVFEHAEPVFDQLVREMEASSARNKQPVRFTRGILEPLFKMAVGESMTRVRTTTTAGARNAAADKVAAAVRLGPGAAGSEREQPIVASEKEQTMLGSLARGGGVDEKAVVKGYAERKRGEQE